MGIVQVTVCQLRRQRGGVEHLLLIVFIKARTRFMQAVKRRGNRRRIGEEFTPELHAHLITEVGDLFQLTGIALGYADQLRSVQRDEFMLRHGELAQTQRRAHPERAPVRGTSVKGWRQRELLLERASKRLL